MSGDNFQDVVVLRTDDLFEVRDQGIIIGTASGVGASSLIYSGTGAEGHLAWLPTVNVTVMLPTVGGTILLSGQAIQGLGVSTGGNTAGNTGTTQGTLVLLGGNQITLSQDTAAGSLATVTISGRNAVFGEGVSTGGNTAGNTGTNTGTIVWAGGNGVTLSQSTNASGNTITISGITQSVQPGVTAIGVSTGGNTTGNTGTTQGTVVLAGIGEITLSQVTAAGSLATISISAPAQSIQPAVTAIGVSTGGNTVGNTGTTQGTYVLAAIGNITLSQITSTNGATVTMSVPAQSIQPAVTAIGVSTGGNTAGNTGTTQGTYVLVGSQAVSLSQVTGTAGGTVTINVPVQSIQPGVTAIGVSTGGNTAGNTGTTQGTYVLAGAGAVTLSQVTAAGSSATLTINVPVQSIQPGVTAIGVSTGGNTAGNTGTTQGTYILAGGNQITLSQSTAAGSLATVTISGPNAVFGAGVSTGGNTSGNTATTQGTIVFAGGNQITLSQSTAAGSQATITISARNAVFGEGISNIGNTSGTSGTNTGTIVWAGGNNVTLSQSTGAGGNTITVSAANAVLGAGVSTIGSTTGNTGTTFGTIVFAGGTNITISQATAAGPIATITFDLKKTPVIFFATGHFRVSTGIDIQEAGDNFTISTVVFRREIAGTSGSTTIDILKNGVSIWNINPGNRPTITAASGNAQRVTSVPDVTTIASTDRLEMVLVTVETGSPQDAVVELISA